MISHLLFTLLYLICVCAGKHVTLVSFSRAVSTCLDAAQELAAIGIEAEVINLRSLRPLDFDSVLNSVKKTNHLVSVEHGWPQSGVGAEIVARMVEGKIVCQIYLNYHINMIIVTNIFLNYCNMSILLVIRFIFCFRNPYNVTGSNPHL